MIRCRRRCSAASSHSLPQVGRIVLPALGDSVNGLLKATSVTSVISMEELMRRSEMTTDVLEVFAAAADYLALTTLWDQVQRRVERRLGRADLPAVTLDQAAMTR